MKKMVVALAFLLSPMLLKAQQTPEWYRVYTFDDSVIEIHATDISFTGKETGRVKFRWSFANPQTLKEEPRIKYKSRLEAMEFNCPDRRFRLSAVTLLDAAGKAVRPEEVNPSGQWSDVYSMGMTERLYTSACQLIKLKSRILSPPSSEEIKIKEAKKFARSFSERLEKTKDFAPLVKEFFAPDYLSGYLLDEEKNRLVNLKPEVAAKVSRAELQRYDVALMNLGYLGSLYFVGQSSPASSSESVSDERINPPGLVNLIKNHPYTVAYRGVKNNYDYLAEKIDSPERLWLYTDLLEKVGALFRRDVMKARREKSVESRMALDDLGIDFHLPEAWVCARECLGLPKGTKLFQVNVPVFRLQLANINGKLKVVSAMPYFQ